MKNWHAYLQNTVFTLNVQEYWVLRSTTLSKFYSTNGNYQKLCGLLCTIIVYALQVPLNQSGDSSNT